MLFDVKAENERKSFSADDDDLYGSFSILSLGAALDGRRNKKKSNGNFLENRADNRQQEDDCAGLRFTTLAVREFCDPLRPWECVFDKSSFCGKQRRSFKVAGKASREFSCIKKL